MGKIDAVFIGHSDYLSTNCYNIQAEMIEAMKKEAGVEVTDSTICCTQQEAVEVTRRALAGHPDGVILVFASWLECNVAMSAVKELKGTPAICWGVPLEEVAGVRESTGSYVSATMFQGVIRRVGLPIDTLKGSWRDAKIMEKIAAWAKAAGAYGKLYYSRMGLVGYTSMAIYTGTFDHVLMRYIVGPEVDQMDSYTLIERSKQVPDEKIDEAIAYLKTKTPIAENINQDILRKTMAIYVALKEISKEHQWDGVNVKCQYEFSKEYKAIPCVALSLLAEDGIVTSCEGDTLCAVTMMLLNAMSGDTIAYGDSLSQDGDVITFSPCGFMPFSVGKKGYSVENFPDVPGFNGICVTGTMRPEKVTFARLVEDVGKYHIVYGTGQGIECLPRGGWAPSLEVKLDGDVEKLLDNYAGQHYAIAYGDYSAAIEAYGKIAGIETVRI